MSGRAPPMGSGRWSPPARPASTRRCTGSPTRRPAGPERRRAGHAGELSRTYPNSRWLGDAARSRWRSAVSRTTRAARGAGRRGAQAARHPEPAALGSAQAVPMLQKLLQGSAVAAAEGARAVRAGAELVAGSPQRDDRHRAWHGEQSRPAAEGDSVPGHGRQRREPPGAGRHLPVVHRRGRQAADPARLHGLGRSRPRPGRGDRRERCRSCGRKPCDSSA